MQKKDRFGIRKMTLIALFAAMAYAVTFIFHIKVSFLTFDAKDAVVGIAAMILGPGAGAVISLLVATTENVAVDAKSISQPQNPVSPIVICSNIIPSPVRPC